MATKSFYHDIDLLNVGQLVGARLQNVANGTAETTLAGTLGANNAGLMIYRVDTDVMKIWDGAAFKELAIEVAGDVIFRGTVDASTSLDAQATAASGNQYVVTTAGTLTMTNVTFSPSAVAEVGDVVLFTSATQAYVLQRNIVAASDTTAGIVELATNAETTAGTDSTRAVTPAGLASAMQTNRYTRQHTEVLASVTADTPATVTHGLALVDRDAFVVNVMLGNTQISVDVDSVDANSLTITSSVNLTNVRITVVGASSTEFAI